MSQWVKLCSIANAPAPGQVIEWTIEQNQKAVCLANVDGNFSALDNWCPHRQGPLGQGWIEGGNVLCPWHAWAFSLQTGVAEPPEKAQVAVYPLQIDGDDLLVQID